MDSEGTDRLYDLALVPGDVDMNGFWHVRFDGTVFNNEP